jgi:hypothetical protein
MNLFTATAPVRDLALLENISPELNSFECIFEPMHSYFKFILHHKFRKQCVKAKNWMLKLLSFAAHFLISPNLKCMFHLSTVEPVTYQTLKSIFGIPVLQKDFALAGGTSLSLQLGHRKSIDLDIFSSQAFDIRQVELLLSAEPGLKFELTNSNRNMLFSYINTVKCDFVFEPHRLINLYFQYDGVNYFSVPDIAAMKMHTICGRGKRKDFFDIYVLIENFGWNQLLDWFKSKYDENQLYFLWRSICYFDDADEDVAITGLPPYTKTWDEIKVYISEKCI